MADGYLPSWPEKAEGIIAPDERLPWGSTIVVGLQHVVAMFGATVLAPILMGFDPNVSILFSGIGTLIFFFITAGRVPSYLGSSFSFIGVVIAAPRTIRRTDLRSIRSCVIFIAWAFVGSFVMLGRGGPRPFDVDQTVKRRGQKPTASSATEAAMVPASATP